MAVSPANLMSSTVTTDKLPDEVLVEVMLRVPTPAALVHAAATSKSWRRVIATKKFLDAYRKRHKSPPFLGLYTPREYGGLPLFQKSELIQSADDGDDCDLDLQRAAAKAVSLRGIESHPEWRLLDCYNGRLLLARGNKSQEVLHVYNPLSRECISVRLPQDDILLDDTTTCLLQGSGNDTSSFRVVSVQHHRHGRGWMVHVVEYDSCRKSWNHLMDWEVLKNFKGAERSQVMHAANLVFCKYANADAPLILMLDMKNMQFSLLPLPIYFIHQSYAIGEIEDDVCCLAAVDSVGKSHSLHFRVWKLEALDWKLVKEIQVEQVLGNLAPSGYFLYRVGKVTNGMAVLCWTRGNLHFIIDLKTFCAMEKFESNKDLTAFPMQMRWPPAFSVATVPDVCERVSDFMQSTPSTGAHKNMCVNLGTHYANVVNKTQNHVDTVMNPGSGEGNNPGTAGAALGGEAEGAETC